MSDSAKLTFMVQDKHSKIWQVPRWKEVEVENANCPICTELMVVVKGNPMYAICTKCRKYFFP